MVCNPLRRLPSYPRVVDPRKRNGIMKYNCRRYCCCHQGTSEPKLASPCIWVTLLSSLMAFSISFFSSEDILTWGNWIKPVIVNSTVDGVDQNSNRGVRGKYIYILRLFAWLDNPIIWEFGVWATNPADDHAKLLGFWGHGNLGWRPWCEVYPGDLI